MSGFPVTTEQTKTCVSEFRLNKACLFLLTITFLLVSFQSQAQSTITSAQTGAWDVGTTWIGGTVPSTTDNAIIQSGHTVSIATGSGETINDLTIEAGAVLDARNKDMTVNGKLIIDGTYTSDENSAKDLFFNGDTLGGTGTIAINEETKNIEINASAVIIPSAHLHIFSNVLVKSNCTVTNQGHIEVSGDVDGENAATSIWTQDNNAELEAAGLLMGTGLLNASATGNRIKYYQQGPQAVKTPETSSYYDLIIAGTGTKTMGAHLVISHNLTINSGTLDGNNFNIELQGDWLNASDFIEGTGTVSLTGTADQSITNASGEQFFGLTINKSSGTTILESDMVVSNTLTLASGILDAQSGSLTLGTGLGATGSISHTDGHIYGPFKRWINVASTFHFPVGSASSYQPLYITLNGLSSGGTLTARFYDEDPANAGLPLFDNPDSVFNAFVDGFWGLDAGDGFDLGVGNDYNISLNGTGFTAFSINNSTRVLFRPDAVSNWDTEGSHQSPLGSTARRTGMTSMSAQYAFGDTSNCSRPVTSVITGSTEICAGTTGIPYSVTDNPPNTYTWIITGGNQASGGNTHDITVDWGATGMADGNVRVIESNACTQGSPVDLPVIIHSIQPESVSGKISVAENTQDEPYTIPGRAGYTYTWTITGGVQDYGGNSDSITVDWGSNGTGIVSVQAEMPGCGKSPATEIEVNKYVIIESVQSGDWDDPGTWDCNCEPLNTPPYDNVRINNTHTVNLVAGGAGTEVKHFIIEAGGTLNSNSKNMVIHGDFELNGTFVGTSNKTLIMSGFGSSIDGIGSLSEGIVINANIYFTTTAVINVTSGDLDLNAGIEVENYGTVTVTENITGGDASSQWTNMTNATLRIGGAVLATGILDASVTGNTVSYNGTGAQVVTVPQTSYYNLMTEIGGIKTLAGNMDVDGDVTINGTSTLDVSGSNYAINLAGDWNNPGATFNEQNGRVILDGSSAQTISGQETFFDLQVDNSSNILFDDSITISNDLVMNGGDVDPQGNLVTVGTGCGSPGTIIHSSGTVLGKLERWICVTDTPYLFPIGSIGNHRPATLTFTDLGTGSLVTEFISGDPGAAGLPQGEGTVNVVNQYTEGYWDVNADNGLTSNDYNIRLTATNFNSYTIIPGTRVIKRITGNDWTLEGVHSPAAAPDLFRDTLDQGIDAAGIQFGLGDVACTGISLDRTITNVSCFGGSDGEIDVTVNGGTAPYTFSWAHGPSTEDVAGLSAGDYDLNVVDNDGCEVDSTYTVNEPAVLDATVDSTRVTCTGGSDGNITISSPTGGHGTYEYTIDGGVVWQGSGSFTGLAADTFDVRIRDAVYPSCELIIDGELVLTEPNDYIPPAAVCRDTTVYLGSGGTVAIDSSFVDGGSSDNCGISAITLSQSIFDCTATGANVITMTVTDVNSNTAQCNPTVTVLDTVPPTITCPGDRMETVGGSCSFTLPDYTVLAVTGDNCSVAGVTQSPVAGTVISGHGTVRVITLTVTDASMNSAQCTFNVTLDDATAPAAVCRDTTVYLGSGGTVAIDSSFVDGGSSDNCGISAITLSQSIFDCTATGANVITMTVTDVNSNTAQCNPTVTVLDTVPPTITCPGDRDEEVDGSMNYTIPDFTGLAITSDNCTVPGVTQLPVSGTVISGAGTVQTITLTADDGNGNTANCNFDITLVSPGPPTIACPADTNEFIDNNCQFILHDYTGTATVTGATSIVQSPASGTVLSGAGTVQPVILIAKNDPGDSAYCSFNIILNDTIHPAISCVNDTSITLAAGECSIAVNGIAPVSATDNCTISSISYVFTGATTGSGMNDASGSAFNKGMTTVWYKILDNSNNADSCSFNLTVITQVVPPDSAYSDRDSICAGDGVVQLMYGGGTMVGGGSAVWYDDPSLTGTIGSGNPIVLPAPVTSTTYFIRFEGSCDTSAAVSTTVHVLPASSRPASAHADRDSLCPGDGLITLSYTGGVLGHRASAEWYSDNMFNDHVGSGNNIIIPAPDSTTTFLVRFEGECDTTLGVPVTVTIKTLSTAPDAASASSDTICPGDGPLILSYTGGMSGTGANATWYDDAGLTDPIGTGNDLVIPEPGSSTTYYVRFEGECDTTAFASAPVVVASLPYPVFLEADTTVCISGPLYRYVVSGFPGSGYSWTLTGGQISTDLSDTIYVDWGNTAGTFTLEVSENTVSGCVSSPIQARIFADGPTVDLGDDRDICEGIPELITPSGNYTHHMWHDNSTGQDYIADTTELVRIQVFDANGCTASDSVMVNLYPTPSVNLGGDTVHCGPLVLSLDAGNPGATYLWSTGETTQQVNVSENIDIIWVLVTYGPDCTTGDTLRITQCSVQDYFANIPNLFTPNGDSKNDTWFFYESASFPEMVIEIYDRWGRLVYLSEPGYPEPWDGTSISGDPLPMDSYHYIIKLNDGFEEVMGAVTIVR